MGKGMKAGKKSGGNKMKGASQARQMQQMQAMQQKMEEIQEELDQKEAETTAGGGAVKAKINGKKELVSLEISPDAMDPDDVEMLQDLIIAAVNEGIRQIEEMSRSEMEKLTGGLSLPGLF